MNASHHQVRLGDLQISLGRPRVVAESATGRCWYPDILKFATGELMLNHSVNPDSNENQTNAQAVYLSTDHGLTWDFAYDVNGFHNAGGEVRISLSDGRIVGVSTYLRARPPGQGRSFVAHYWTYDKGGRRYAVEPWAVLVEGLPRDVEHWEKPSRTWWSRINWFSDIVILDDGRFVTTLSMRYRGDSRETTEALISDDEGYHWQYLSTIAGPDAIPDATEGFDEPCLIQLTDGDLMCVSRVGSGKPQLLARSYSSDGGKTWSALDRLPAYSVAPQIVRLQNGVLALSTGRPGLFAWFSADPRGKTWQVIDIMAYHNSAVEGLFKMTERQTTAYTALVEVQDNQFFLVYDRTPFGWKEVAADSGERSQIYLLEMGVQRG